MWELIFLMVILKIPIVYLCWVVYWAVKAEPKPEDGEAALVIRDDRGPGPFRPRRGPRRPPRPHGGPARRYARTARAVAASSRR